MLKIDQILFERLEKQTKNEIISILENVKNLNETFEKNKNTADYSYIETINSVLSALQIANTEIEKHLKQLNLNVIPVN
jgi:hypothetical protein